MKVPKTFDEAAEIVGHPELSVMLESKLIQLAFGANATVAFRAVEMLFGMPRNERDNELDVLSDAELKQLELELSAVYARFLKK